MENISGDSVTH